MKKRSKILPLISLLTALCLLLVVPVSATGGVKNYTVDSLNLSLSLPDTMTCYDKAAIESAGPNTTDVLLLFANEMTSQLSYIDAFMPLTLQMVFGQTDGSNGMTGGIILSLSMSQMIEEFGEDLDAQANVSDFSDAALFMEIMGEATDSLDVYESNGNVFIAMSLDDDGGYVIQYCTFIGDQLVFFSFFSFNALSSHELTKQSQQIMDTVVFTAPGFADMQNHWAKAYVDKAVELELFSGTSATTFSPNDNMTRGMLVQVLYRLAGEPEVSPSRFTDIADGDWYADAVAWAAENGIVDGIDGKFQPNSPVTREQLAAILYRHAKFTGRDVTVPEESSVLETLPDADSVSSWAAEAMGWAVGTDLINGIDGKLAPKRTATRAQVATILVRYLEHA